ncbi:MAG: hypothetical protein IJN82_03520, partial [Clostridia bacterium]|nr:hypothetical protein [Clostridia bacterium]
KMIGISLGHPCYEKDEENHSISLFGRKTKNKFNQQDPDTYNAFTVRSNSIVIGFDDKGFYGEVIHPDVVVVRYENNGNSEEFKCSEFFEIKPDPNVRFRIGKQYFGFKDPFATVPTSFNPIPAEEPSAEGMGDIFGRRGIRPRR